MVHCDRPGLDVGADTHRLGRPDQHRDRPSRHAANSVAFAESVLACCM
jgi:hypothetical protein